MNSQDMYGITRCTSLSTLIVAGHFSDRSNIVADSHDSTEWNKCHRRILNIVTHAPPSTKRVVIEIEVAGIKTNDDTCAYVQNTAWRLIDTRLSARAGLQVTVVFRTIYSSGAYARRQWEAFPAAIGVVKEQIPQLISKGMVTFSELYSSRGRVPC